MAVFQVGAPQGMIKDVNPTALPKEFFSHTENTRFEDNAAKKILLVLCRYCKNIQN